MTQEQVTDLFHKARAPEYQSTLKGCREILAQLDRYRTSHRGSIDQLRSKLDRVKRELDRIQAIDYLETPIGRRARDLWETAAKRLRAVEARPHSAVGRKRGSLPPPGSTWVTRPRPHIDRIASAWLIGASYDADARFAFADGADAARKAFLSTCSARSSGIQGRTVTFETLIKRFGVKDRRAKVIAEIVHEADLHDGKFTRSEATGIDLAIKGLAEATPDDQDLLERAWRSSMASTRC